MKQNYMNLFVIAGLLAATAQFETFALADAELAQGNAAIAIAQSHLDILANILGVTSDDFHFTSDVGPGSKYEKVLNAAMPILKKYNSSDLAKDSNDTIIARTKSVLAAINGSVLQIVAANNYLSVGTLEQLKTNARQATQKELLLIDLFTGKLSLKEFGPKLATIK